MPARPLQLILAILFAATAAAQPLDRKSPLTPAERRQGHSNRTLIAKPKAGVTAAEIAAVEIGAGRTVQREFPRFGNLRILQAGASETAAQAITRLQATGLYEYVEPDYVRTPKAVPNDPRFNTDQWYLRNTGQAGGVAGADIGAIAAWDTRTDASTVLVAIIDTGIRATHEDLAANLWTNPNEIPGNGIDDDGDGYIDDVHGINVLVAQDSRQSGSPDDDVGHGTAVASVIGAVGNNGKGMAGIAWQVKIMALKWDDAEGSAITSNEVECIDFALAKGARIINISYGGGSYSRAEFDAIKRARDAGAIVVAAAGNEGFSNDLIPSYPSNYLLDNVLGVAATDRTDSLSSFSNYGVGTVELAAPGTAILVAQQTSDTGYRVTDGTSFSSPLVAGALALLKAQFPNDNYLSLINRLLRSTDPLTKLGGKVLTGGRLNIARALTSTSDRPFNDDFAARAPLAGNFFTLRANTYRASAEMGEPAHADLPASGTLWWSWTPTSSGPAVVDTTGSGFDTVVGVYTGATLASLTRVAGNDDNTGTVTSYATFDVVAGTTYQIAVGGKGDTTGALVVGIGLVPPNDRFVNATRLSGFSFRQQGFNNVSSGETGEPKPSSTAKGRTVWYAWTAPSSDYYTFSVFAYGFNAVAAVYSGSNFDTLVKLDTASELSYNEGAIFQALAGSTYYFQIDSTDGNTGSFAITLVDGLAIDGLDPQNSTPALTPDLKSLIFASTYGDIVFLNAVTGAAKTATVRGSLDVQSPVVGRDGSIYIGDDLGYFYSYTSTGTLRWRQDLGNVEVTSSAAIGADDAIYVHTDDGQLHGFYPDGSLKWRAPVPGESYSSPSIGADGTIYIGSSDQNLYALSPLNGALKWKFKADGEIYSTPAIGADGALYFGTLNSKFYAVNLDGTQRWIYTAGDSISSSPALAPDGTVYFGCYDGGLYALSSSGTFKWKYATGAEIRASSPAVAADGTIYIGSYDGFMHAVTSTGGARRTYATGAYIRSSPMLADGGLFFGSGDNRVYVFDLGVEVADSPWPQHRQNFRHTGRQLTSTSGPVIYSASANQVVSNNGAATLAVNAGGADGIAFQWQLNGSAISGATNSNYTLAVTPAQTGLYSPVITNNAGTLTGAPVIVGLTSSAKLVGAGTEFPNIAHPNGNIFDQILLESAAATMTADPGQVLRISFLDLTDDIVQVEFSGPGALSLVLANASGPVAPAKYNQTTTYMKGHAGIVITGATENTHLSIFSVGRGTAVNQALFKDNVTYDGFADIAFVAIASGNGKFGGLRSANASYLAARGYTGIYAPGVTFTGPVFVGDITASDTATPMLMLGSASDVRVTGGDLEQANGRAVQVSGITRLVFAPGSNSHNVLFPAQPNKARLEENGVDVTARIVVNP